VPVVPYTGEDFEPVIPDERAMGPLRELANQVQRASLELAGLAGTSLQDALGPLLRAMNSYYTNRIEGQHTLPHEIERAIRNDLDAKPDLARRQRLALAHMAAEEELETAYGARRVQALFAADVVREVHRELYERLPADDRRTDESVDVVPGELRTREVKVGNHHPPPPQSLPSMLDRFAARYGALPDGETLLVGVACAHHRLAWIHPFIDGNGRTARLHSHVLLHAMGLTRGLWSPMRGLARRHEDYYAYLANAGSSRRNDLDGRGALSQEQLVAFARFFLDVCRDQTVFMRDLLRLPELRARLDALLVFENRHGHPELKPEAATALHYALLAGPLERGEFLRMLGMPERSARRVLSALLDFGLLKSPSSKGRLQFSIPLRALRFLFPALWPEAEADVAG
jgi:Fic family protein